MRDNDYVDLWLREINAILDSKSYEDIGKNEEISRIIRQDIQTELNGFYMTFIDTRGQDLILTDVYPTTEDYPMNRDWSVRLHLHSFFPITPSRLLILNHIMFKPENKNSEFKNIINFSKIKGNILVDPKPIYTKPGVYSKDDTYIYKVQKIYEKDVQYINHLYLNESKTGIAFCKKDRISSSIATYEELPMGYRKQSFIELNDCLNKISIYK